jgi:hypothetical protein
MDADRFDALTKTLGVVHTRRGLARLLGGLGLGGALSALGTGEVFAAKLKGGAPCTENRQCKSRKCVGPDGNKQCSCSKKFKACMQPADPCLKATCDVATKSCVIDNPEVACPSGAVRRPNDCSATSCCYGDARQFLDSEECENFCCSGNCLQPDPSGAGNDGWLCQGRGYGHDCTFDEECSSGECQGASAPATATSAMVFVTPHVTRHYRRAIPRPAPAAPRTVPAVPVAPPAVQATVTGARAAVLTTAHRASLTRSARVTTAPTRRSNASVGSIPDPLPARSAAARWSRFAAIGGLSSTAACA